jgi:hypothetical protein
MTTQSIFVLQFVLSLAFIATLANWLWAPRLATMSRNDALFWLTIPHAFRHIGMAFLVPGLLAGPLPADFAVPAAYGDLASGLLAFGTLVMLRNGNRGAFAMAWLLNIVGSVDLVNALRHVEVVESFGAVWFIPTFLVPLLLVTHAMMFTRLISQQFSEGGPDTA